MFVKWHINEQKFSVTRSMYSMSDYRSPIGVYSKSPTTNYNTKIANTPQPLYNMVRNNMVLDITRISAGPQMVIKDLYSSKKSKDQLIRFPFVQH